MAKNRFYEQFFPLTPSTDPSQTTTLRRLDSDACKYSALENYYNIPKASTTLKLGKSFCSNNELDPCPDMSNSLFHPQIAFYTSALLWTLSRQWPL